MAVTYSSYLKLDELLRCSSRSRTDPSTTRCCSSSSTRSTSCGSRSCCTSWTTSSGLLAQRDTPRALAHAEARAHDPQGGGGADRRARDDDAAANSFPFASGSNRGAGSSPISSASWSSCSGTSIRPRSSAMRRAAPRGRRLERRLAEPTVWDAFLRFLAASGLPVPPGASRARRDRADQPVARRCRRCSIDLYRARSAVAVSSASGCRSGRGRAGVALPPREDGAAHDRHKARHRRIVEGAEYLMTTLNSSLFPDLWEIRTDL